MSNVEHEILREHSHMPGEAAMPCSLPDLLHNASQIVELLHHKNWSALSACSRQLRQLVQQATRVAHINSRDDVDLLLKYKRPQLSVVVIRDTTDAEFTINNSLTDASLQVNNVDSRVHTCIMFSNKRYYQSYNLHAMLVILDTPEEQQHLGCQAEQILAGISRWTPCRMWEYVRVLVATNKAAAKGITALLACLRHVKMLNLAMSGLDRAGIQQLVDARQQSLEVLNISNNKLDADSVKLLANSSWPRFKEIDLSNNQLDCQTLAHLFTAGWQLKVLCLRGSELKADSMAVLAADGPNSLRVLDLQDKQLDAAAMYQLARGNWPNLRVLRLSDNNLDDDAMGHLSTGAWPKLCTLEVARNFVTFDGLRRSATANFLCVETLAVTEQEMRWSLPGVAQMTFCSGRRHYWNIQFDSDLICLEIEEHTAAHISFKAWQL